MRRACFIVWVACCSAPPQLLVPKLTHSLAVEMVIPAAAEDLDPDAALIRLVLRAEPLPEGHPSGFRYAYNGQVPGPTINAEIGQTLEVQLVNGLSAGTTIHWHGLHLPNAMDGVPWQRDPIAPGAAFTYRFTLSQVGTFWYHPHFNTAGQVDGGLYGALIVRDPAAQAADHDLVALIDDRAEVEEDGAAKRATGHGRRRRHWMVNGASPGFFNAAAGSSVRLRLINVSNHGYVRLVGDDLRWIASDQGPFTAPRSVAEIVLAPGDRSELEFRLGAQLLGLSIAPYSLNGGAALGAARLLFALRPSGVGAAPEALRLNPQVRVQHPDPGYADIVWAFAGSDRTGKWFINGRRFPDSDIDEVALNATVILEVRNLSPTEHPYHLHGHTFEVVSRNGVAPPQPTYEDTINIRIRERVRLRLIADNPGDWMSHCHILPHAEDGMMTVLRVVP
jgi:FtsP/CotA-like multicopper oxidase with cupredoxin domain